MPSKEEIAEFSIDNELDNQLALKINRVFETMNKEQKINGELSQFNIDVCLIFDALIKRKPKENLTATEILIKRQSEYIQIEKEKHLKNRIEQLEAERKKVEATLEDYKERKRYYDDEKIEHDEEYYRIEGKIDVLQELLKGEKNE